MNNYSIENKEAIITGATKGMGLAISKQLLQLNAKVVMVYYNDVKNAQKVEKKLEVHSSQFLILKADITKAEDRHLILEETLRKFKKINILVNNAGTPAQAGFLKELEKDFDFVLDGGYLSHCPGR